MDVWLNEQPEKFPFEPYEKLLYIAGTGPVLEGDMAEEVCIIEVDPKYAGKAKRYNKKRMSIYDKIEGFSYKIEMYITTEDTPDLELKKQFEEWKERMKAK